MSPSRFTLKHYLPRWTHANKPDLVDDQMEYVTLESREASFAPPTKRSKAGWPHKSPTPHDLAIAGFFWKPTLSKDNVECFMCSRQLDGWEKDDDALEEHLKHGSDCAWATLMALARQREFNTSDTDDPTGAHLTEARRSTFETLGWPHQSKRGWTCKTEKMVEAGWHFAPTTECEDYTSCVYCKLSLDGWEPKDDPFEEHYRRSPECVFFTFAGTTAPSKRPKAKKARASTAKTARASAQSRMSTQSNATFVSQADESTGIIEILGHDTTIEEDTANNSLISMQSTTSTATSKGKRKATSRAKGAVQKKAKITRGKKLESVSQDEYHSEPATQSQMELDTQETVNTQPSQDVDVEQKKVKPKGKKPRAKKKKDSTPEPEPEPHLQVDEQVIVIEDSRMTENPKAVKSKGKASKGKKNKVEADSALKDEAEMQGDPIQCKDTSRQSQTTQEDLSYPALPQDTLDEFEDAPEQVQTRDVTPQPPGALTSPPAQHSSPIPLKETSPLKEQRNPPRPTISPAQIQDNPLPTRRSLRSSQQNAPPPSLPEQRAQTESSRSPSQPSDLENRPPSGLPPSSRPPLSSPGAPPPSWTPVDLDVLINAVNSHEGNTEASVTEAEKLLLGDSVTGQLTQKEKEMTVQEWIEFVASRAEERLSAEGERIVSVFERQGRLAMTTLEAVECI